MSERYWRVAQGLLVSERYWRVAQGLLVSDLFCCVLQGWQEEKTDQGCE